MMTKWTQHLTDPEEKKKFEKYIRGSGELLDRMKDILDEMERELDRSELNRELYDSPNWEYRQADMIGDRRRLRTIKRLINLE